MTRFQAGVVAFWVLVIGLLAYQWFTLPPVKVDQEAINKRNATREYVRPTKEVEGKVYISDSEIIPEASDQYHYQFKFRASNQGEVTVKNVTIRVMPYRYGYIGTEDGDRIKKEDPNYNVIEVARIPLLKPGEHKDFVFEFLNIKDYVPIAQIDPASVKFEVVPNAPAAATATPVSAKPAPAKP